MRAALTRERLSGALQADAAEQEHLADAILLDLTYWIPLAELLGPESLDDGTAQLRAMARVMLMIAPWLREPECGQFRRLASDYLSSAR